ncbi:hypothetical protein SDC9_181979 [bioreactor metagenome]|uniref:Uncharacterized protein n=1 Tax=bioreactor metagenome TaxID=1076179 RepID=A0A645H672_9ZZZZ
MTETDCTDGESYATTSSVPVSTVVRPLLSVTVDRTVFVPTVFSSFVEKELPEYVAPLTVVEIDEIDEPYTPEAEMLTLSLLFRCTKHPNCVANSSIASENQIDPVGTTDAGIEAFMLTCVVPSRTPFE